jgi:hypothetical protein
MENHANEEHPERDQGGDVEQLPLVVEESLERIEADDVRIDEDLAPEQVFDTQHGEGHTYNPHHAQDQGLTYTPPNDPPVVPSHDDPQGAEMAAGFAPSMEESSPDARVLPPNMDDNDLEIQDNIYRALRYNSETAHLTEVEVEVNNGVALLRGTVTDQRDIPLVHKIIQELDGVLDVRNYLEVDAWSSPSESDANE